MARTDNAIRMGCDGNKGTAKSSIGYSPQNGSIDRSLARSHLASDNPLSPLVLFFALGLLAARLESDLEIPQAVGKALSLYLMLSIGFRGGAELAHSGLSSSIMPVAAVAVSLLLLENDTGIVYLSDVEVVRDTHF